MKLRTTEELWILDGEIGPPWFQFRDGTGALGLASQEGKPIPLRIPKGSVIYVDLPERPNDGKTRVPVSGRGMDTVHLPTRINMDIDTYAELLATLGHEGKQDLFCGCTCKGCGSGGHCYDARCYPLPVRRFNEEPGE